MTISTRTTSMSPRRQSKSKSVNSKYVPPRHSRASRRKSLSPRSGVRTPNNSQSHVNTRSVGTKCDNLKKRKVGTSHQQSTFSDEGSVEGKAKKKLNRDVMASVLNMNNQGNVNEKAGHDGNSRDDLLKDYGSKPGDKEKPNDDMQSVAPQSDDEEVEPGCYQDDDEKFDAEEDGKDYDSKGRDPQDVFRSGNEEKEKLQDESMYTGRHFKLKKNNIRNVTKKTIASTISLYRRRRGNSF